MKHIVFLLAVVLLSGCGSQKRVVAAKPQMAPSWYTNPPQSNSSVLYALGEGKDQKEAVAEALSAMVSTLSVSISSSYNAKTTIREGTINSSDATYKSDIQTDVAKIRISNYEIVNSKSFGFRRYAVLVKSDKKRLFKSMKQDLDQRFFKIDQEIKSLQSANALKQLAYYKNQKESLLDVADILRVMSSLDGSFHPDGYLKKVQKIERAYEQIIQNLSFSIKASGDAKEFTSPIAKGLSEKSLKLKDAKDKMHFTIFIKANIEKATAYGFTLARSEIRIVTKDYKGVTIGSNVLNIVGQSSQGYGIAKQSAVVKLNALVKKEGIYKVLGLSI